MRVPIRARMTAWYVALLALIIAAAGVFVVLRLRADLIAAMDHRLRPAAEQIARGYHAEGPPEARDTAGTVLSGQAAAAQVLTPEGRVVVSFGDRLSRAPMLRPAELRAVLGGRRITRTAALGAPPQRFRIIGQPTTRGSYRRAVVAAEPMATVDRSVQRLVTLLLLACPVAILATAAGGWWLAGRALRPIGRLTTDAGRIGMDRLADRLPVPPTGDEVARLATTLNTMLARVQAGIEDQRRLVADASHELRTPLAAMRAEIDVSLRADGLDDAARRVLSSMLEEVVRLARTVDALLALARADQGGLDLHVEPVDLGAIAGDAVERFAALAASRDVTLEARLDSAPAEGDDAWLGRAVDNLIDNAIKFGPAGGTVTVTTGRDGEDVLVSVLDEGPGIPPDARELVFDRFRRLDASRTRATGGTGIGLSIVREIARAHRGRASVQAGPRGGSLFVLAMPGVPDRAPRPARRSAAVG